MSGQKEFSYAAFALFTLGSGAVVLLLASALVAILRPAPGIGLAIALGGVVGAIATMAFVSKRYLNRATGSSGDPDKADEPRNR